MPFSNDVELLRKKLFLSQEDFAKEIGVSFATVNRWETEKTNPLPVVKERFFNFCHQEGLDLQTLTKEMRK